MSWSGPCPCPCQLTGRLLLRMLRILLLAASLGLSFEAGGGAVAAGVANTCGLPSLAVLMGSGIIGGVNVGMCSKADSANSLMVFAASNESRS